MNSQATAEASALEKKIRACFDRAEMYLTELGPVIGTHDGPGAIEIAFRTDLN